MTDNINSVHLPQLVTLPNVDILATGTWALSSGEATFTAQDLANAVQAAQCPAVGSPVLKLGHIDPRFDGEPAVGRVMNLSLTADGNKITGDLSGMPAWLGTILASAYPNRSIEGYYDFACQVGHVHPFAIKALALLGVTPPGVGVLSSLADVAALYGIAASDGGAGRPWKTGGTMPPVLAAGVTTEDVRRAYYDASSTPMSWWITELQLAPTAQLIVCDEASANIYRVPITIKGTDVSFGDPVQVQVEYQDLPADGAVAAAARWGSPVAARAGLVAAAWNGGQQVKNLGDDPTAAQIKALFALPGDSKSDSKLPHHDVSDDGKVGAADTDGVEAALAALNGSQGGLKDVSDEDKKAAYDHLAAHYKAAGKTPPPLMAAAALHPFNGEHSHPHSAMGSQGGDDDHDHMHKHTGDGVHDHHSAATAGANVTGNGAKPAKEGPGMQIEVTEEDLAALRTQLGKPADAELTGAEILAGLKDRDAKVSAAAAKVTAAADADKSMVRVDATQWAQMQQDVKAGQEARTEQRKQHRDGVMNAAVRAGKFPPARKEHWEKLWAADPEGTEELIGTLAAGIVPITDIGDAGGEPGSTEDALYDELFGPVDGKRG
jgi:hypothetical protein